MMKETLESVDKLHSDLDEAKVQQTNTEGRVRAAEERVALVEEKVKALEAQAVKAQTSTA